MDNKTKKEERIKNEEQERLEILRNADSIKGEQLFLGSDGRFESKREIEDFVLKDIDDPEKKYDVYYKGIHKLLREHLPKGKEFQEAREYIYEEKNILVTRGKKKDKGGIRGADSRMGYISDLDIALDIISSWIMESGSMYDLYIKFRKANEERDYHDVTSNKEFKENLSKVINTHKQKSGDSETS